jgi:hypothetical protein
MTVVWDVAPCSLVEVTDVSEVLAASIIRVMEAASTSENSVNFYQTTRHNIPEDCHLHTRRRENLKYHQVKILPDEYNCYIMWYNDLSETTCFDFIKSRLHGSKDTLNLKELQKVFKLGFSQAYLFSVLLLSYFTS